MRQIKNHKITRLFTFMIALQIINMSIGTPGGGLLSDASSSGGFNYIDTYAEFITEVILKYEHAIPESKNRQHKELQHHKQYRLIFSMVEPPHIFDLNGLYGNKPDTGYFAKFTYQFVKEITPPPPRFA